MPKNLYDKILTNKINGYKLIHQNIIYLDKLRMITDLITANWRLNKEISRIELLQRYYKLEISKHGIDKKKIKNEKNKNEKIIIKKLINKIWKFDDIIFIGEFSSLYYKKLKLTNSLVCIEIITENLFNVAKKCFKIIKKIINKYNLFSNVQKFNIDKLNIKYYNKYFQFWDKKIEICYDNIPIIIIYKNNEKCIPFQLTSIKNKKFKIGTFNVSLLHNLIA